MNNSDTILNTTKEELYINFINNIYERNQLLNWIIDICESEDEILYYPFVDVDPQLVLVNTINLLYRKTGKRKLIIAFEESITTLLLQELDSKVKNKHHIFVYIYTFTTLLPKGSAAERLLNGLYNHIENYSLGEIIYAGRPIQPEILELFSRISANTPLIYVSKQKINLIIETYFKHNPTPRSTVLLLDHYYRDAINQDKYFDIIDNLLINYPQYSKFITGNIIANYNSKPKLSLMNLALWIMKDISLGNIEDIKLNLYKRIHDFINQRYENNVNQEEEIDYWHHPLVCLKLCLDLYFNKGYLNEISVLSRWLNLLNQEASNLNKIFTKNTDKNSLKLFETIENDLYSQTIILFNKYTLLGSSNIDLNIKDRSVIINLNKEEKEIPMTSYVQNVFDFLSTTSNGLEENFIDDILISSDGEKKHRSFSTFSSLLSNSFNRSNLTKNLN